MTRIELEARKEVINDLIDSIVWNSGEDLELRNVMLNEVWDGLNKTARTIFEMIIIERTCQCHNPFTFYPPGWGPDE